MALTQSPISNFLPPGSGNSHSQKLGRTGHPEVDTDNSLKSYALTSPAPRVESVISKCAGSKLETGVVGWH